MVVTLGNWLNGRLSCEQIEQLWCELIIPKQNKEQKESEFFTAATAITGYQNSSVSFCNTALLLISEFFPAPLAKQKEAQYNMTKRTKMVMFKEAQAWLFPITILSSSARRC